MIIVPDLIMYSFKKM